MRILAIDIGGTKIKADAYSEQGKSLGEYREIATSVDLQQQTNNIPEQICSLVADYQSKLTLDGVAISSAGVVDPASGEIVYSGYTIPNYAGCNFTKLIKDNFALPTAVENDVNCAALGEKWLGIAQGINDFALITVGTGIGGAIVQNGQIYHGHAFTAGEVGYLPVGTADWQTKASTKALIKAYEERSGLQQQNGFIFMAAVQRHDKLALEVLETYLGNLCQGLAMLSYILNPEMLVLGGGIMENTLLLPLIKTKLLSQLQAARFMPKRLELASLGNEAGRLGAVYNFLQRQK